MNTFPIVLFTCRSLDNAGDLLKLRDAHPDTIVVKQLDITHYEKSFKEFVQEIKEGENFCEWARSVPTSLHVVLAQKRSMEGEGSKKKGKFIQ